MSYFLTEDQTLIKNAVRDFCLDPGTQKMIAEAYQTGGFPLKCWQAVADMGFIGVSIPEEYGGQGHSLTTEFIVMETLGNYGYPVVGAIIAHNLGMLAINFWGNEEQKKKYLIPAASGKAICAGAFNDPAGSFNFPEWGLSVVEDGDNCILNGSKITVTNAEISDIKIIFTKDPESGLCTQGYIVEKGTPGVSGQQEQKMVPNLNDWGTISLNNVRVSKKNKLEGKNVDIPWLSLGFATTALMSFSMAQIAFSKTLEFAKQRSRYGKPLTDLQAVSHRLVNMSISNEASRCLLYTAAKLWDEGMYDECVRMCSIAKIFVTESANKTMHDATVLHGAFGVTSQSIVGPLWASSLQLEIAEGPADFHRDYVAATYGIKPGWKDGRP